MFSIAECPKCGSTDIYYNPQPQIGGGWISIHKEGRVSSVMLTYLACTQCYYIQAYASDSGIENISNAWRPLNPPKQKYKNDE